MGDTLKRLFDFTASFAGLLVVLPFLLVAAVAIMLEDVHGPLYVAPRVGRGGRLFSLVKLRTMGVGSDARGWDSTKADDPRITRVGRILRRYKLDEFPQLWNVLKGDMSLVGPRPNVHRETERYSSFERQLLGVRPGITDFSSIVFADLAEILEGHSDPDIAYRDLVRRAKGRLGVFYVHNHSLWLDLQLILLTLIGLVHRPWALAGVQRALRERGAGEDLVRLGGRCDPLVGTS